MNQSMFAILELLGLGVNDHYGETKKVNTELVRESRTFWPSNRPSVLGFSHVDRVGYTHFSPH